MIKAQLNYLKSPQHVRDLLGQCKPKLTPRVLAAAFDLWAPSTPRDRILSDTEAFFRTKATRVPTGLDDLPSCWLQDLPVLLWQSCKPHWEFVPYMITSLCLEDGVLCVAYAQELPTRETRLTQWDRLRMYLNMSLRPNLWITLTHQQEQEIWRRRPDLQAELFQVPN